jgi:kynurenine formamidase
MFIFVANLKSPRMQIIDLSHEIHDDMTVFSGTEPVRIYRKNKIETDGYNLHEIYINSHTGTHIDAPAHTQAGQKFLDDFPLEKFVGKGLMLQVGAFSGGEIPLSFFEAQKEKIKNCDFILLNSSWYKLWQTKDYHANYPILSLEAAEWLTQQNLKGIGLDMISIDKVDSQTLPLHAIVLGAGMLILENLNNLDALPESGFQLQCFPLKIRQADGSTSRILAFID